MAADTEQRANATWPPGLRLRKHADYQRAYAAAARKQHSREMSFFVGRRTAMPQRRLHPDEAPLPAEPRIGLTVPKALGKAHDRNRIKRRLRAAAALHAGELAGLPVDVILHPRRSVLLLDWPKLSREVQQVLRTVRKTAETPTAAQAAASGAQPATLRTQPSDAVRKP